MKSQRNTIIFWAALAGLLVIIFGKKVATWYDLIIDYLVKYEWYRSKPYWDVNRWSWGYGTRVPGSIDNRNINPGGTITETQAGIDAYTHVLNDYDYLSELILIPLSSRQWAAYLDFSYNLGRGAADNLVNNINSRNWGALRSQWLQYVNAEGEYREDLYLRRLFEITEFLKDT